MGATAKKQKREVYRNKVAAVTSAESGEAALAALKLPQKKYYRQRAHANPFSDHLLKYPLSPAHMDWATHFPAFVNPDPSQTNLAGTRKLIKDVEVVDIGCGFGGLLVGLAPVLPDTLMVGMEIRVQVTEYLTNRIKALRHQQALKLQLQQSSAASTPAAAPSPSPAPAPETSTANDPSVDDSEIFPSTLIPGGYQNITAIRANTMKFLPNFFARGQLSKIFICFPDPHFKARKHKARIVSETLNAEYAYALRPGGLLYTITDVEEYHYWILRHFGYDVEAEQAQKQGEGQEEVQESVGKREGSAEMFERVSEEDIEKDECVRVMKEATEEGKKVARNGGNKYVAVFRRKSDPEWV